LNCQSCYRKAKPDRRDKSLGLFDRQFCIFWADRIAAVISELAKSLHFVEGFPVVRRHMTGKHHAPTELSDKPVMSLDWCGYSFNAESKQDA